jgi:uncharacterized protein YdaU (DUF1376 family)
MSKRPWYKRFGADFIAGTLMLSLEEKGAYSILLDLMYDRGAPIPDDAKWLATVMGCSTRRWGTIRKRLIDTGKIQAEENYLTNKRAIFQSKAEDLEHQKFTENGAKASRKSVENVPKVIRKSAENSTNISRTTAEAEAQSIENNDLDEKLLKPNGSGGLEHRAGAPPPSQKLDSSTNLSASALDTAREADADAKLVAIAVDVGKKVTDLMGVTDDPRWLGNWSMVQAWLNEGFSPETDILPTVATIVQKLKRSNRAMPSTLNYFTKAIRENYQIRRGSGVSPVSPNTGSEFREVKAGSRAFKAWIEHWRNEGRKTTWLEQQRSITVPTEFPGASANV